MPFSAHETMEVHECLLEKINAITHFNIYAKQARHPRLLDMITRHQQEELASYNEIVALTRGSGRFAPVPSNTNVSGISNQQIRYGLNNPQQFVPQPDTQLSDGEIAIAMLLCHKNGARNCTYAALECADPNLRRALQNSAATCMNQAYEVFLFANEQGLYQVPTLPEQTERSFLERYQPAPQQLQQQYGMQSGGFGAQAGMGMSSSNINMPGQVSSAMFTGSRDSVLYGNGAGAMPGSMNPQQQGQMQ